MKCAINIELTVSVKYFFWNQQHRYRGVKHHTEKSFFGKTKKFEAHYFKKRKRFSIGFYETSILAAKVYDKTIVQERGVKKAMRHLNFPQVSFPTKCENFSHIFFSNDCFW